MTDIISTQKYLIKSPRKVREVVTLIKKMKPADAVETLPLVGKSAAEPLVKVIKSAIANASVKGISTTDLIFKEIQVGEGPRLKRGKPVSKGQWHPRKKRMSHIRVVLTTLNEKMPNDKLQMEDKKATKKVKENLESKKGGKDGRESVVASSE